MTPNADSVRVEHRGDGVWVAVLDQDAVEDIAYYLTFGARHSTDWKRINGVADKFQAALDSAFPDGAQDPTPAAQIDGSVADRNWREWAEFLAAYVDYNHGSGVSDRAWDSYLGIGPDDERPSWVRSLAAQNDITR